MKYINSEEVKKDRHNHEKIGTTYLNEYIPRKNRLSHSKAPGQISVISESKTLGAIVRVLIFDARAGCLGTNSFVWKYADTGVVRDKEPCQHCTGPLNPTSRLVQTRRLVHCGKLEITIKGMLTRNK